MRPVTHYLLAYTTELGCTPEFRKKEMFHLTMHSTHFISSYMVDACSDG